MLQHRALGATSQGQNLGRKASSVKRIAAVNGIVHRSAVLFGSSNRLRGFIRAQATQAEVKTAAPVKAPESGTKPVAAPASVKIDQTPVVVLGSQGATAIQLVKSLLEAGYKVVAAVDFPEAAKETLDFVKKYELIPRAALSNLKLVDVSADTSDLPRRAKVLVVEGDEVAGKKVDAKAVEAAIETAKEAQAAQFLLVTPGAPAGGTGLFGWGAPSPTQPNKALSRLETALALSGLSYTIVRASATAQVDLDRAPAVAAGPGAVAPAASPVTRAQLSSVLGAVLNTPPAPAGIQLVLEVTASAVASPEPVEAAVAKALAEARAKAPPPPAAALSNAISAPAKLGPLALGTISMKKALEDQDRPKAAPAKPAAPGTKPAAPAPVPAAKRASSPAPESPSEAAAGGFFASLFGGAAPKKTEKEEKPAPPKPAPKPVVAAKPPPPPPKPAPKPAPAPVKPPSPPPRPAPVAAKPPSGTTPIRKPVPAPVSTTPVRRAPSPPPPSTVRKAVPAKAEEEKPRASSPGIFGFFAINPEPARAAEPPKAVSKPGPAPAKPAPKPAPPPPPKPAPKPAPVAVKAPPPPKPAPKPAPPPAKPAPAPVKKAVPTKAEEEKPRASSPGIFGFFAINPEPARATESSKSAPAKPAPKPAPAPPPKPAPKPVVAAKPPPPPPKPAPKPAPAPPSRSASISSSRSKSPEPEPKKEKNSGGFLASLFGWGAAPKDAEEDEPKARPGTQARKPAPAPPTKPTTSSARPGSAPAVGTQKKVGTTVTSRPASAGTQRAGTQSSSTQKLAKPGTQAAKPGTQISGTQRGTFIPVRGYSVAPKDKK